MTKQHYILIAASIKASRKDTTQWSLGKGEQKTANEVIMHLVSNLCSALAQDNPRFDQDRFLQACGVTA